MRIDLDEHYSIEINKWGDPVLVKHKVNAELDVNYSAINDRASGNTK